MSTEHLAGFRDRLNGIDEQLISLLGERFEICREVADVKKEQGIPMMQSGRVDEVKARCKKLGEQQRVAPEFIEDLYTLIIGEACRLEDEIIDATDAAT